MTDAHDAAHAHPSDKSYIGIAVILGVVTAIEVALSYIHIGNANAPLLLIGMAVKFFLVASFFMHLKFDSKVLRRLFISGLVLALFCYVVALSMFRQFDKDHRQQVKYTPSGITQS
jgi:cytochrome c oxidase subunit 4